MHGILDGPGEVSLFAQRVEGPGGCRSNNRCYFRTSLEGTLVAKKLRLWAGAQEGCNRHTHPPPHKQQHATQKSNPTNTLTHTHACSIPYSTVQTVSVHLEHCYQSCLQVLQRKLQRKPGPDTNTRNTQTGHMQQRLVLRAHYNLGSAKSSLFMSKHVGMSTHTHTHTHIDRDIENPKNKTACVRGESLARAT